MRTDCFHRSRVRKSDEKLRFVFKAQIQGTYCQESELPQHIGQAPRPVILKNIYHFIHYLKFCHLRKSGMTGKRVKGWYWHWCSLVTLKKIKTPNCQCEPDRAIPRVRGKTAIQNLGDPMALPEDTVPSTPYPWSEVNGIELH